MADELRASLNNLTSQGHPQKDVIDKYKSHLAEILQMEKPVLIDYIKIVLSSGKTYYCSYPDKN